jgi:Aspartyl/Asparaginyl beta-hydroxylase
MTADELLAGIRDADLHRGGIRCLRLFRVARELARALGAEVDWLCATEQGSDVQEREHVTHWTGPHGAVRQFSLLNRGGGFADFRDDHDLSCRDKKFHQADRYPRLAAFVACFPHAINFRVNVLGVGAGLSPHEEHCLFRSNAGTAAVRARFHLPIRTSRQARMTLEGDVVRFVPRTIYYFNQGSVHAANNGGNAPRIHLVWDMLLTARVFDLMFGDDVPPEGLRRLSRDAQAVPVLARDPIARYARMPPRVTPPEADRLALCPVQ